MLIYFAGADNKQHARLLATCGVKNILVSYHTMMTSGVDIEDVVTPFNTFGYKPSLFLDSGGFVARLKNKPIDVRAYAEYARVRRKDVTVAANLDTNDLAESQSNHDFLQGILAPVPVLPVYHPTEYLGPADERDLLAKWCETHDYIAIGGVAGAKLSADVVIRYLDYVFSITRDRVKVHGFGITKMDLLRRYPFYSVDSTTWLNGGMYGEVFKFMGDTVKKHRSLSVVAKNANRTIETADQLGSYFYKCRANIEAFVRFEKYLTDLWSERGVTWS